MTANKPILTIGRYQLVYRSSQDFDSLAKQEQDESINWTMLYLSANMGVFFALTHLIFGTLDGVGTPVWLMLGVVFVILFAAMFGLRAWLSSFKLIDTKNIAPTPSQHHQDWLQEVLLFILALLGGVQFYARYWTDLPASSGMMMALNLAILVLAVPYYIRQIRAWLR